MARAKSGVATARKRKSILQHTKGFRWGRKSKLRTAKEALAHAWTYSYRDRKTRKRDFRKLWQVKIGAATQAEGMPYNQFIHLLKEKKIELNRKTLAHLAEEKPEIFKKIISFVK